LPNLTVDRLNVDGVGGSPNFINLYHY
jgi:hypothetical protein